MEIAQNYQSDAEELFRKWLDRTVEILERERFAKKVEDSRKLKESLRGVVVQVAANELGGQIHFLTRGRFVDMGAGRKRKIEQVNSRQRRKTRRPKKWYSPVFYGRLNDLEGALGIKLMERSSEAFTKTLV